MLLEMQQQGLEDSYGLDSLRQKPFDDSEKIPGRSGEGIGELLDL
jgi:hypothetical protein